MTATTPAKGWQCQPWDDKDASAMMTMMPVQWGKASATTAKTPARQGQQRQRNNARELMAMTPMQ
jgi:hypothetical protein